MSQLPAVPFGMRISPELAEYLTAFRRELEAELDARPEILQGVLYLGGDRPVRIISPGGKIYALTVNEVGDLVTTEVTS